MEIYKIMIIDKLKKYIIKINKLKSKTKIE
jgi:hypothetical protein